MISQSNIGSWDDARTWYASEHVEPLMQELSATFRLFWSRVSEHSLAALFLWANEGWRETDPPPPVLFGSAITLSDVVRRDAYHRITSQSRGAQSIRECLVEAHLRAVRRLFDGYFFQGPYHIALRWCEHCLGEHLAEDLSIADPGLVLFKDAWPAVKERLWKQCIQSPQKCRSLRSYFTARTATTPTTVQGSTAVAGVRASAELYQIQTQSGIAGLSPMHALVFAGIVGIGSQFFSTGTITTNALIVEELDPIADNIAVRPGPPQLLPIRPHPGGAGPPVGNPGSKGLTGGSHPLQGGRQGTTIKPGNADVPSTNPVGKQEELVVPNWSMAGSGIAQGTTSGRGSGSGADGFGGDGSDVKAPKPPPPSHFDLAKRDLSSCISQKGSFTFQNKSFTRESTGVRINGGEPRPSEHNLIEDALAYCQGRPKE